jgi:hypothetical protein
MSVPLASILRRLVRTRPALAFRDSVKVFTAYIRIPELKQHGAGEHHPQLINKERQDADVPRTARIKETEGCCLDQPAKYR